MSLNLETTHTELEHEIPTFPQVSWLYGVRIRPPQSARVLLKFAYHLLTSERRRFGHAVGGEARARKRGAAHGRLSDPTGHLRSAGTFASEREARAAGRRAESSVEIGSWFDRTAGKVTFRDYVEHTWWPSGHLCRA